ncbi:MAG: hypothetical protein PVF87_00845, partial [Acidimicrobiia bacterium]
MEGGPYEAHLVSIPVALKRSPLPVAIALAVVVAGCSSILGETPVDPSGEATEDSGHTATTQTATSACVRFTGDHSTDVDTGTLGGDALYLSGEVFLCADDVVVVADSDLNAVAAASQLAAAMSGPLLFPDPRLSAELGRLKPKRVHLVGSPTVNVPTNAETITHDVAGALELAGETMGVTRETSIPSTPNATTVVETVLAIESGDRVAIPADAPGATGTTVTPTTQGPTTIAEPEIISGLARGSDSASFWIVDSSEPATILLASAVGRSLGASVIAVDGDDLLAYPEVGEVLAGQTGETTRFIGGAPEAADWELAVLANGQQIPGGGYHILPEDQPRRYVAFYGHPGTDDLGALGEQGPAETRQRMEEFVSAYGGDGAQV